MSAINIKKNIPINAKIIKMSDVRLRAFFEHGFNTEFRVSWVFILVLQLFNPAHAGCIWFVWELIDSLTIVECIKKHMSHLLDTQDNYRTDTDFIITLLLLY
jgi:hypothetical protein